jgi:hypothetical protein
VNEDVAQRGELSVGHYVYGMKMAYDDMNHSLQQLEKYKIFDISSYRSQVHVTLLPPSYRPLPWLIVRIPIGGSLLNQHYLGNYDCLFDHDGAKPLPS